MSGAGPGRSGGAAQEDLRTTHPRRRRGRDLARLAALLVPWTLPSLSPAPCLAQGGGASGFRSVSPDAGRARALLAGVWAGDGRRFTFDADALAANLDPALPFQWDPVAIIDVTGPMVIFEVGRDRYLALLGDDTMTVTRAGSPETWTLRRSPGGPAHP
ncbi:hypothetical protein [Methylobacterium sp. JK268]